MESSFPTYGLSFRQPAGWQRPTYDVDSSFSSLIAYLSTEPLRAPCSTTRDGTGTTISCGSPLRQVRPGGVFITWSTFGMPGLRLAKQQGVSEMIGRHPARVPLFQTSSPIPGHQPGYR